MAKRHTAKRISTAGRAAQATKRAQRNATRLPPPPEQGLLEADLDPADPDASFRDQCLLYRDFKREVMLEEVCRFVTGASAGELQVLRRRMTARARHLRTSVGKRGRPVARNDSHWLYRGRHIAWWRVIEKETWPAIAARLGMDTTKGSLSTARRWLDEFAEIVRRAMPQPCLPGESEREWVERVLANRSASGVLRFRTGLPLLECPEECARILRELVAPRQ